MNYQINFRINCVDVSFYLLSFESFDQHEFITATRIEDVLVYADGIIEYHLAFNLEIMMLHMYMRKAFDPIDHHSLMAALRSR